MNTQQPRIIIVGAGFGGLFAARALANKPVDVLLIDRNNFHTFTPLLYQVATCALDPSEIAYPVRTIFRKNRNIRTLLGSVTAIDYANKTIDVQVGGQTRQEPYDYLILATGSVPTYFGQDAFRENALELRTLSDAVNLRNHILSLFEQATWVTDEATREAMTTIVVVGGGPTGLETAGAIFELYNHVLNREFLHRDLSTRVVLVEMQPFLLAPYPDKLRQAALEQLRSLGVEVQLGSPLQEVASDHVTLADGTRIDTHTLVWAAGVKGSPLAELLNVPLQRGGRLPILSTTEVAERPGVYAVGDMTYLEDASGQPYPMVIPVAQQQGELAAQNILAEMGVGEKRPFHYHDRGSMATIGRRRAVAWLYNKVQLRGYIAWLAWLALHLITLLGFRNRLNVFVNWVWNYFTYDRSVRIILEQGEGKVRSEK
ncbi:MAG: NAD(P)/FAD-dependent oxidoreductase [Ardenticatenaceae bacterium]|nr:NAD(P)/FAD-dependent oxidoreductase [Anaerolineales bacterium]MCB8940826.1 NAD(P)/FAD-dependent oxidoreductase [Ardenticatenaceae bacterium]MCB8972165.1 NAD(P)/FAD-dependent oxidoreductase [Ardenticatenaceae bacterium]